MSSPVASTNALLQAALEYARRGWHVVPLHSCDPKTKTCSCRKKDCQSPAKHPRTQHGFKEATTDEKTIRHWWSLWPDSNVGVETGKRSGIIVVDVDPRNGGERPSGLPDTPETITGGGGAHIFFRYPSVRPMRWPKAIAAGVDLKADGGYVVAAPSRHASGGVYAWDGARGLDELELADPPDWMLAKNVDRQSKDFDPITDSAWIKEGGRNNALTRFAGQLRRVGVPPAVLLSSLRAMNADHCQPPLPDEEIEAIARSVGRYDPAPEEPPHPADDPELYGEGGPTSAPSASPLEGAPVPDSRPIPDDVVLHPRVQSFATLIQIMRYESDACFGADRIEFDLLAQTPTIGRKALTDSLVSHARERIERNFRHFRTEQHLKFGSADIRAAIDHIAHDHEFHPVAEYLRSLTWDGIARLDRLVDDVVGTPTKNARTLLRRWFIAAAKRGLNPGCKMDNVLLLQGAQGIGKSTFCAVLGGRWFSDTRMDLRQKDALARMSSCWLLEWAELQAMLQARNNDEVTAFITSAEDEFRPPYGHFLVRVPRTAVIVATTNREEFLPGQHGTRRFWPIHVDAIDVDELRAQRDQLWAESVAAVNRGEQHYLTDEEDAQRTELSEQYIEEPAATDLLQQAVDTWDKSTVSVAEILKKAGAHLPFSKLDEMLAADVLRRSGWIRYRGRVQGSAEKRPWRWRKVVSE